MTNDTTYDEPHSSSTLIRSPSPSLTWTHSSLLRASLFQPSRTALSRRCPVVWTWLITKLVHHILFRRMGGTGEGEGWGAQGACPPTYPLKLVLHTHWNFCATHVWHLLLCKNIAYISWVGVEVGWRGWNIDGSLTWEWLFYLYLVIPKKKVSHSFFHCIESNVQSQDI